MHCWGRWIYEEAHGRISSQVSWRSCCRKRNEFIESLQSGAQIYSYASKATRDEILGKLEEILAWQLTKGRNKQEVIAEARNKGTNVHFASLMDLCHLKNSELEPKFQKYRGRVLLRGDTVKDDSGSYAEFTEQGSSASQMICAKVMDIMDVKQEKRIDDYWNIDGSRDLSDPWTGFTQFTLLEEKAPDGYMWSGGRLTRKQLTSRPDHLWPELRKSMGKHAKLKEKHKWSEVKLHLENARKLRGIYFSSTPTIRNSRIPSRTRVRSWKHQWLLLCLPKLWKIVGVMDPTKLKTKLACILEADESTRMRMGNSIPSNHEDHIAGKGENSLQHYNLVHKFIPMPQKLWKFRQQKQQWTRNVKNWRKFRRGTWPKSKVRNRWSRKQGPRALQFILHH